MSWENQRATVETYNDVTAAGYGPVVDTVWRRVKWAALISMAWSVANRDDMPNLADVWSCSNYIEHVLWPRQLFELAMEHPDATAADLVRLGHNLVDRENWQTMLECRASQRWLAAATPPARRYSLDWPGRKDTAP